MSPEERQLLQGLFDRMKDNSSAPRDAEAERLIADNVRQQPYAPYLMAQAVLVQDQALQAANTRLQELEAQVQQQTQSGGGGGGFLSSIFGSSASQPRQAPPPVPAPRPVWNQGGAQGYPQQGGGYPQQQNYAPQGGPWGGGGAPMMGGGGGGFLSGALQTAAGVAGGVMLADGIRGLFGGHNNPMGIASGMPGMGGDTVVNNYYGDGGSSADARQDMAQDAADFGNSGGSSADYQQDADQDQDFAQDASDFGVDDNSFDA